LSLKRRLSNRRRRNQLSATVCTENVAKVSQSALNATAAGRVSVATYPSRVRQERTRTKDGASTSTRLVRTKSFPRESPSSSVLMRGPNGLKSLQIPSLPPILRLATIPMWHLDLRLIPTISSHPRVNNIRVLRVAASLDSSPKSTTRFHGC